MPGNESSMVGIVNWTLTY